MSKIFCFLIITFLILGFSGCCLKFSDMTYGSTYIVGDTFTTSGKVIKVERFYFGNENWNDGGKAKVDNRHYALGGSGFDLNARSVNLKFLFDYPIKKISLKFGEFGGKINIKINGVLRIESDLINLNNTTLAGVQITVQATQDGNNWGGILTMIGEINEFVIGGEELWVDDICQSR